MEGFSGQGTKEREPKVYEAIGESGRQKRGPTASMESPADNSQRYPCLNPEKAGDQS